MYKCFICTTTGAVPASMRQILSGLTDVAAAHGSRALDGVKR